MLQLIGVYARPLKRVIVARSLVTQVGKSIATSGILSAPLSWQALRGVFTDAVLHGAYQATALRRNQDE